MKLLRQGSALGELPYYIAADDGAHASTIRELLNVLDRTKGDARTLDPIGLRQYFDRRPDGERTCFQNAKRLPAGSDLYVGEGATLHTRRRDFSESNHPLLDLLEIVVADLLARADNPVVALSGGLDSALVLALVRRVGGNAIPVVTLATQFAGYCELEQTLATARALEIDSVEVITMGEDEFRAALPDAIAACETPLFNLHPVSKLLLARAVAQRGCHALITGDGADQVFAGADGRNYLPIVGALARGAATTLLSPFFDERVVGWAGRHVIDVDKTELRRAASAVLPAELVWRKKTPRLAPDFDLSCLRDAELESRLAARFGLNPPDLTPGPQQTLWATAAILIRQLGGRC
jgi:asparagine synthase (glutamine-hydrolysing)